ncbi:DUF4232 domain-containing protein [Streptomyces sp. NPDC048606]|uniref:DUF4232 domain-containing protein n=1 Tax=Streptomyces sp. NPDC048606 TaxID=3154726 RepID=UPI003443CB22
MITRVRMRVRGGGAAAGGLLLAAALLGCGTTVAPGAAGPAGAPGTPAAVPSGAVRADGLPTAPTDTPATPSATACEGGVRLLEGPGNAAMGLRVADFQLINCGSGDYVLNGYPEIRLLDGQGRPVEVHVGHGTNGVTIMDNFDAPPRKVTLRPGQAASVGLVWRNTVTEVSTPPAEGRVLELTPKPGAPRLRLPLASPVDLGTTGRLGLSAWSAVSR